MKEEMEGEKRAVETGEEREEGLGRATGEREREEEEERICEGRMVWRGAGVIHL